MGHKEWSFFLELNYSSLFCPIWKFFEKKITLPEKMFFHIISFFPKSSQTKKNCIYDFLYTKRCIIKSSIDW